jgi:hypothetical protein
VARFFIDTSTGQVATQRQLSEAGISSAAGIPPAPWHLVQGTGDATTMWYAVLRKRVRDDVYIGTLALRHTEHHASLLQQGWQEIPPSDIRVPDAGR